MLARFQLAGLLAALILCGGLAPAQPILAVPADNLVQEGQKQLAATNWTAAEISFRRALESEPENPQAHEGLGQSLFQLARFQEALAVCRKTLDLVPSNTMVHYHIGRCQYGLGDFTNAAGAFQQFTAANPTNASGLFYLGRSLARLQRFSEAEAALRRAIGTRPAPAHYYDEWGYCLASLSRHAEAIAAYEKVLSLDEDNSHARLGLGTSHYETKAYRQALADLEKYVAANPKDFDGLYYLGLTCVELKEYKRGANVLQRAHELRPRDWFTRLSLCLCYMTTDQPVKACELYPAVYMVGGGVLSFGYAVGVAWLLVRSCRTRPNRAPASSPGNPGHACPLPPLLSECQALPPVLPGFIAKDGTKAGPKDNSRDAWPGLGLLAGWFFLFIAGQVPCTFLLVSLASMPSSVAMLAGMGASSLPLIFAWITSFRRQPWGAPFAWPMRLPAGKVIGLFLIGLEGIVLFQGAFSQVVEWITHKPFPIQITVSLIREGLQTHPLTVAVSIVLLVPIAEELLFRGLLFGALQRWLSPRWTIVLTAAIFTLVHMQPIYFLPMLPVGLLLGLARQKSGSLALPMVLHIINNGASLLLLQLFPEAA